MRDLFLCVALATSASLVFACSCDDSDGLAATGDGSVANGQDGAPGTGQDGSRGDGSLGDRSQGDGPEVCDGVDNDGNGIIDDVDVGGDGVCDCLLIATLGLPGEWGDGDVFAAWLDERSDNGATALGDQVLTTELLDAFQVLVVQDIRGRSYSDAEVQALSRWVSAGGGLMTLIGYGSPSERENVNRLLEPSGVQYDDTPILAGSPTVPVTDWETHPVSAYVSQVGVDNGYEVIGAGDVVAREQGLVVLRANTLGQGKVLVWGDEWITYDSEWTEHPEYQLERFWLNAIKWLTPAEQCQVPILR